jgi:glycerol-3-phosphate acyltransferase PlsY
MPMKYLLIIISYFLGSIPFSVILGKITKNIDIRQHGSKNPGGTNALRHLGLTIGIVVIILDAFKSGIIVLLIQTDVLPKELLFHPLVYGLAAAFGHVFSIFLKFKGGKAVATTVGMLIGYYIPYALLVLGAFFLVLKITKYVSVASVTSVFMMIPTGLIVGFTTGDFHLLWFMLILWLLVLWRHKGNFQNIKQNKEPKITWM